MKALVCGLEAWREPLRVSSAVAAGTGAEGPGWGWGVAEWSCVHTLALPPTHTSGRPTSPSQNRASEPGNANVPVRKGWFEVQTLGLAVAGQAQERQTDPGTDASVPKALGAREQPDKAGRGKGHLPGITGSPVG